MIFICNFIERRRDTLFSSPGPILASHSPVEIRSSGSRRSASAGVYDTLPAPLVPSPGVEVGAAQITAPERGDKPERNSQQHPPKGFGDGVGGVGGERFGGASDIFTGFFQPRHAILIGLRPLVDG